MSDDALKNMARVLESIASGVRRGYISSIELKWDGGNTVSGSLYVQSEDRETSLHIPLAPLFLPANDTKLNM